MGVIINFNISIADDYVSNSPWWDLWVFVGQRWSLIGRGMQLLSGLLVPLIIVGLLGCNAATLLVLHKCQRGLGFPYLGLGM